MTSLKTFLATIFGILGAVILTSIVALFGVIVLGLTFGFSLLAVGAAAVVAKKVEDAQAEAPRITAPRFAI